MALLTRRQYALFLKSGCVSVEMGNTVGVGSINLFDEAERALGKDVGVKECRAYFSVTYDNKLVRIGPVEVTLDTFNKASFTQTSYSLAERMDEKIKSYEDL